MKREKPTITPSSVNCTQGRPYHIFMAFQKRIRKGSTSEPLSAALTWLQTRLQKQFWLLWLETLNTTYKIPKTLFPESIIWDQEPGAQVIPTVADIYMEEVDSRAKHLYTRGNKTNSLVQIRVFHLSHNPNPRSWGINSVNSNIQFNWEDDKNSRWSFLDSAVYIENSGRVNFWGLPKIYT